MEHPDDERPWGWGVCSVCFLDCMEDDYNPMTGRSTHRACEVREPESLHTDLQLDPKRVA
jgi:hypothetical protein